jgi:cell division protein FtsB
MPPSTRRRAALAYLGLVGLLLCGSALDPGGLRKWRRLAGEARRIEAENREIGRENERLRREVRALQGDAAALERAAREELGYVRPGEIVIKLDGSTGP